jgi:hypothetical protein
MTDPFPNPPRWAHLLLMAVLNPADSETIPGDLLEEYREVRRPSLGRVRANLWYVRHVLSVLLRAVWPGMIAIAAVRMLSFPLPPGWNPSLVQAPGVSLLDAVIFLGVGYYGAQRTGRLAGGIVMSTLTSLLGFTVFLSYASMRDPSLLLAPFEKPFIVVILVTLLALTLSLGLVLGSLGAAAGRHLPPALRRARV